MAGARDRYQSTEAAARASTLRKIQAQRWLQREIAFDTIAACCNSPDRRMPGTFANDVLVAVAAEEPNSEGFVQTAKRALR